MKSSLTLFLLCYPLLVAWGQHYSKKPIKKTNGKLPTDQMPIFPGGEDALMDYCYEHLNFPEEAIIKQIEGTVLVQFMIDETGEILDNTVKIVQSLNPKCDKAIAEFVRQLPPWQPAYNAQLNKHVAMPYNLPIFFSTDYWKPKHWGKYYLYKAQKAFQYRQWKKALNQIKLAIQHDSKNPVYYILKAKLFLQRNESAAACVEYQHAKQLNDEIRDHALEQNCH